MSSRSLALVAAACFVVGSGVTVAGDTALTLVPGVLLMVASIVVGALAIATPEYLSDGDGD